MVIISSTMALCDGDSQGVDKKGKSNNLHTEKSHGEEVGTSL